MRKCPNTGALEMQPWHMEPRPTWRLRSATPLLKCLLIVGWVAVACWAAPCIPDGALIVPVTTEAGLTTAGYQQIAADIELSQTLDIEEGPVAFVSTGGFQLQCSQVKDVVINVMGSAEVCLDGLVFKGCNSTIFNIAPGAKLQAYNVQIIGSATISKPLIIINNTAVSLDNVTISGNTLTHTHLIRMEGGSASLTISGNSVIKDNNLTADSSLLHADLQQVTKGEPVAAVQFLSSTAVEGNRAGRLVSVVSRGQSASPSDRELSDNVSLETFKKNDMSLLQAWMPTETVPAITINGANFVNNDVYLELIALYRAVLQVQQALFQGNTGWGIPVETYMKPSNSTSGSRTAGRAFISQNIKSSLASPFTTPVPERIPPCGCCIKLANNSMPSDATIQIPVFPFSWNDEQTKDCASHANLMLSSHLAAEVAKPQGRPDSVSFAQLLGDQKSKCPCDGALPPDTRLVSHMIGLADSFLWIEQSTFSGNNFSYGSILETSNHTTVILRESTFDSNTAQTILNVTAVSTKLNWTAYQNARYLDDQCREWTRPGTIKLYADNLQNLTKYTDIIHHNMLSTPVYVGLSNFTNNKVHTGILRSWGTRGGDLFKISTYDEHSASWYIHDSKLEQNEQLNAANLVNASNVAEKYLIPSMIGFIHVNATLLNVKLLNNKAVRVVNIEASSTTVLGCTISGNHVVDNHMVWWTKWATLGIHHTHFTDNCVNCTAGLLQVVGANTWLHDSSFTNNAYSSAASLVSFTSTNLTSQALLFMKNCTYYNNTAGKVFFTSEFKNVLTCSQDITSTDCIRGNRNKFLNNTGTSLFIYKPDKVVQSDWATTNFTGIEAMGNKNATCGTLHVQLGAENKMNISQSIFKDNEAVKGGAICLEDEVAPDSSKMSGLIIGPGVEMSNNTATDFDGGAVAAAGETSFLQVFKSTMSQNRALNGSGGGIFALVKQLILDSVIITGNAAASGGGITYISTTTSNGDPSSSIQTSTIDGNTAVKSRTAPTRAGGAMIDILPCGGGGGGGLCLVSPLAKSMLINNRSSVSNNKATYGGAFYVDCGSRPTSECWAAISIPDTRVENNKANATLGGFAFMSANNSLQVLPCCSAANCLNSTVTLDQAPDASSCDDWNWRDQGMAMMPAMMQAKQSSRTVVSGSQLSVEIVLFDASGQPVTELPGDIFLSATVRPEDLVMVGTVPGPIGGNFSKNGSLWVSSFPNISMWPTINDPNNTNYTITFTATSSYSHSPIAAEFIQVTIPHCTVGQYLVPGMHWCQMCGSNNVSLFSLHPNVRCEPCIPGGSCTSHSSKGQALPSGLLLPKSGFFQTSFLLPQLLRCPIMEACSRSPEDMARLEERLIEWQEEFSVFSLGSKAQMEEYLIGWLSLRSKDSVNYPSKNKEFMRMQCAEGYQGFLCNACASGYGRYFSRCLKCFNPWLNSFLLLLIILGMLAIVAFLTSGHLRKTVRRAANAPGSSIAMPTTRAGTPLSPGNMRARMAKFEQSNAALNPSSTVPACHPVTSFDKLSHIFKVLVTFVQVNYITKGVLQMSFPRLLRQFFTGMDFSSSSGSWVSVDCSLKAFDLDPGTVAIIRSVVMMCLPVICILLASFFWMLHSVVLLKTKRLPSNLWKEYLVPRIWLTTLQICFFLYPLVTLNIFEVFTCDPLRPPNGAVEEEYWGHRRHPNGTMEYTGWEKIWRQECDGGPCYMPAWVADHGSLEAKRGFWSQNYDTLCRTGKHAVLWWALGVPMLIFFAVGVPVGLVGLLWGRRHKLQQPKTLLLFGFLYDEYKSNFSYWEAVIMARKVALLAVTVYVPYVHTTYKQFIQVSSCILIMQVCFLLHLNYQPFTDTLLNRLETMSLMTTLVNLAFYTYFLVPDLERRTQIVITIIVMVMNLLVLFYFVYHLASHARQALMLILRQRPTNPRSFLRVRSARTSICSCRLGEACLDCLGRLCGCSKDRSREQDSAAEEGWHGRREDEDASWLPGSHDDVAPAGQDDQNRNASVTDSSGMTTMVEGDGRAVSVHVPPPPGSSFGGSAVAKQPRLSNVAGRGNPYSHQESSGQTGVRQVAPDVGTAPGHPGNDFGQSTPIQSAFNIQNTTDPWGTSLPSTGSVQSNSYDHTSNLALARTSPHIVDKTSDARITSSSPMDAYALRYSSLVIPRHLIDPDMPISSSSHSQPVSGATGSLPDMYDMHPDQAPHLPRRHLTAAADDSFQQSETSFVTSREQTGVQPHTPPPQSSTQPRSYSKQPRKQSQSNLLQTTAPTRPSKAPAHVLRSPPTTAQSASSQYSYHSQPNSTHSAGVQRVLTEGASEQSLAYGMPQLMGESDWGTSEWLHREASPIGVVRTVRGGAVEVKVEPEADREDFRML